MKRKKRKEESKKKEEVAVKDEVVKVTNKNKQKQVLSVHVACNIAID